MRHSYIVDVALELNLNRMVLCSLRWRQCSRRNTYFTFFSDFKKTWLFTFFEMTYQKVVKSHRKVSTLLNV